MAKCNNCGEDKELKFLVISEDGVELGEICEDCSHEVNYPEAPPFELRAL